MSAEDIWILYDGQCPFCSAYVRMLRLRQNFNVHLSDARGDSALKAEATAAEYDLDDGMVVKFGGRLYYGPNAMTALALLTTPSGIFNRLVAALFRSKTRAKYIYPVFAFFRGLTVRLLGRGMIGNLRKKN